MTNTNCLEGIKCPACGNEDQFRIAGRALFTVTDDGTEDHGDIEWDDDSYADCSECGRHGTLRDFRAEPASPADSAPYFRGASGRRYSYAEVADRIRKEAPHTLGQHISVQLQAIGLYDEMKNGTTPCGLPFTFAEAAGVLREPAAPADRNPDSPSTHRERSLTMTHMLKHTPGPWECDLDYIVAPDPDGRHPDIYIAEIAAEDSEGRVASVEQQIANRQLITAAPEMLEALLLAQRALNTAPRFRVGDTDSYAIAAIVDTAIATATVITE